MGSKDKHGSFHLWINVWVAGDPSLTSANLSALEMSIAHL